MYIFRPVSDSPAVFSLARRQISFALLALFAQREKREIARFYQKISSQCLKFCNVQQGITFLSHPV